MACEEAWKQALQEMMAIKPYTHLGQVVPMNQDELGAHSRAQEKFAAAEREWYCP